MDPIESEVERVEFTGHVEGIRSITLDAAKEFLRGQNFDDVFSRFVKSIVENLLERVVDPFVNFTQTEARENFDPIPIPSGNFNISDQFFCLPLTGVVNIGEGNVSNLSSLSKSDDCVVDVQGRILFVRLKLQLSNVSYKAGSTLALFCTNSVFNLIGALATIALNIELQVDFRSLSNLNVDLSKFDFTVDGVDIGVKGDPVPELLAASIKHYYLQEYKNFFQDLSMDKLRICMERAVKKLIPGLNNMSS